MNRSAMSLAALVALGLSGFGAFSSLAPAAAGTAAIVAAATERTETFAIENMTCALCPITVKTAMEYVDGVKSVKVNFDAKTATVVYDPSIATVEAIARASTNAGYPATPAGQGS
ncbi:heavy-metal-associated domain-containing protein [Tistrella bauzanensis]|jgi:mercuric ion binding protein|uniref:Heavy metal transport/detoxification protein n=1 Tax=Oceanibaculum indicum P24 TaxID=1207063 RepID=K2ID87_9PROT|nr:heavy-metal-associated domain-containing protein [Oceanibaculum indicum]EKE67941.1 heavy metal transport/detoxification protein [Oceanibaculum indicum P24]